MRYRSAGVYQKEVSGDSAPPLVWRAWADCEGSTKAMNWANMTRATSANQPDADALDLLCHLAWNAPLLTRRQRAAQARKATQDVFGQYGETAREILGLLLDKYIERGILQFQSLSELMKVRPFDRYGSPSEIASRHFGGMRGLKDAVTRLQSAIYQ